VSVSGDEEGITDAEHKAALTLLNKIENTWGLSATNMTVGPLQGEEEKDITEVLGFETRLTKKYKDCCYDAKFYKITLKTSILVEANDASVDLFSTTNDTSEGHDIHAIGFDIIVGRNGRFKIKEPFRHSPLLDVEDYTKFDTYYIVFYHKIFTGYSFKLELELSNEVQTLSAASKYKYVIIYSVLGSIGFILLVILIVCYIKKKR
jgi:hypothetical protein